MSTLDDAFYDMPKDEPSPGSGSLTGMGMRMGTGTGMGARTQSQSQTPVPGGGPPVARRGSTAIKSRGNKDKETYACAFPGCGQSYSRMEYLKRHQRKRECGLCGMWHVACGTWL